MKKFKGDTVGIKLINRGATDNHICIQMMIEDDTYWTDTDFIVSSSYIDEMIEQLLLTKEYLKTQKPDGLFGWRFK